MYTDKYVLWNIIYYAGAEYTQKGKNMTVKSIYNIV